MFQNVFGFVPYHCDPLTLSEQEILRYVAQGFTVDEISHTLSVKPCTVNTHKNHIRQKLGAKNDVDMVNLARQNNLL